MTKRESYDSILSTPNKARISRELKSRGEWSEPKTKRYLYLDPFGNSRRDQPFYEISLHRCASQSLNHPPSNGFGGDREAKTTITTARDSFSILIGRIAKVCC